MKRRTFLQLSSFSALATGFPEFFSLRSPIGISGENRQTKMLPASWRILDNGAFDIMAGDIAVTGCYPAIGENAFHPEQVRVKRFSGGGLIEYIMGTAKITITLDARQSRSCRIV